MTQSAPWLIVIDMQEVFSRPESEWLVPDFESIIDPVIDLIQKFDTRVVLTKFIAPEDPTGRWVEYYQRWPGQLLTESDSDWDIVFPVKNETPVVCETTFSKWHESLKTIVPSDAKLILCGVATECCVLSTAIAAAESGRHVVVVGDACRGASAELHDAATLILESYSPLIELATIDEVLSSSSRD